jgi:hypothetical protein
LISGILVGMISWGIGVGIMVGFEVEEIRSKGDGLILNIK